MNVTKENGKEWGRREEAKEGEISVSFQSEFLFSFCGEEVQKSIQEFREILVKIKAQKTECKKKAKYKCPHILKSNYKGILAGPVYK
jgi:hypothetical protein